MITVSLSPTWPVTTPGDPAGAGVEPDAPAVAPRGTEVPTSPPPAGELEEPPEQAKATKDRTASAKAPRAARLDLLEHRIPHFQESWFAAPSPLGADRLSETPWRRRRRGVRLRHRCYRELDQSFGCRARINVSAAASDWRFDTEIETLPKRASRPSGPENALSPSPLICLAVVT
jgi:hypothetical protein